MTKNSLHIDPDFVRLLKTGDQTAFTKLVSFYSDKISFTCRKMHLNFEDAQEVCQDVFMKLWENRERLNEDGALNSYIFTMVKNEILKKIRKRAYTVVLERYWKINNSGITNNTEKYIETRELELQTSVFIERLPEQQRQIIQLRIHQDLSNDEISEQMHLSKRTVENQIYRAVKKLKSFLSLNPHS